MITFSGVHIQKIGGECGTPTAQDIAVQSGRITQFGGAVWCPLLTHSVFVGLLALRRSPYHDAYNCVAGLIHDAGHEICTSDVPRNFKCQCMKREQAAIDLRVFDRFLGDRAALVDWKLIKQCDDDAICLQGVELGLPNFEQLHGEAYGAPVYKNETERRILLDLLRSSFYRNTLSQFSPGVIAFQDALLLAEARKYDEFLQAVNSWNLL